ncbi:MAG: GntR family transcriptional regulator [Lentisphaeria bacterium]
MEKKASKKAPYQRLYQILHNQILSGELTDRLPSMSELSLKYNLNRNTVKRAIHQLQEYRFVYGMQGKGVFVNQKNKVNILVQKNVTLYLHQTVMMYPFYQRLVFALRSQLEQERCNVNLINTISQLEAFSDQIDALLLFEQLENSEISQIEKLMDPRRIICCNCHLPLKNCRMVGTDNHAGGRMAMQYLYDQGYRNIAILRVADYDDERSVFFHRWQGVQSFVAEHPDLNIRDCAVPVNALDQQIKQEWIAPLFTDDFQPDAVFLFMDIMVFSLLEYCAKKKKKVAILGYDDQVFACHTFPSLSSIREDTEGVTFATVQQIQDCISKSCNIEKILISPVIVKRESTGD